MSQYKHCGIHESQERGMKRLIVM